MRNDVKKISFKQAEEVIETHHAFIKNIATQNPSSEPAFDDSRNGWGFLIGQLKDPRKVRPIRQLENGIDRSRYFDSSTGLWKTREILGERGREKPDKNTTKKTALSLLPPDGKMVLYHQLHGIALLFDSKKCAIKSKYIFSENIVSNERWWLYGARNGESKPAKEGGRRLPIAATLAQIKRFQEDMIQKNDVPERNEILGELCADAIIGVAIPQNDVLRRLNGQYRQLLLLQKLKIHAPLFIVTPERGVERYRQEMIEADLKFAEAGEEGSLQKDFFIHINLLKKELAEFLAPVDSDVLVEELYEKLISKNWNDAFSIIETAIQQNVNRATLIESLCEKFTNTIFKNSVNDADIGKNVFLILFNAFADALDKKNLDAIAIISAVIDLVIKKTDHEKLINLLSESEKQGSNEGKNSFWFLAAKLQYATYKNNFYVIKIIQNMIMIIIEKVDPEKLINLLSESEKQGNNESKNSFWFLADALRDATYKNNFDIIKVIQNMITVIIEKIDSEKLINLLSESKKQGNDDGRNSFWFLSEALRYATYDNNFDVIKIIQNMITVIIEKVDPENLINLLSENLKQGNYAGRNSFWNLTAALQHATCNNNFNVVEIVQAMIIAIIQKTNSEKLKNLLFENVKRGDNVAEMLTYTLKKENSAFNSLAFFLLIKLADQVISDELFSSILLYKKGVVPLIIEHFSSQSDIGYIEKLTDPKTNLGKYIDYHRNQRMFFNEKKKTDAREKISALILTKKKEFQTLCDAMKDPVDPTIENFWILIKQIKLAIKNNWFSGIEDDVLEKMRFLIEQNNEIKDAAEKLQVLYKTSDDVFSKQFSSFFDKLMENTVRLDCK